MFWLAFADGVTTPFFMVWWLYVDCKEVLYNGYNTPHYSWEFCGTATGLLLPETNLFIFGRKMGPDNANPSTTLGCPLNLLPSAALSNVCCLLYSSFLFFKSVLGNLFCFHLPLLSCKFWCLVIMLTTEHSAVCKFDLQLRFCSSKDVKCVSKAGKLVSQIYTKILI